MSQEGIHHWTKAGSPPHLARASANVCFQEQVVRRDLKLQNLNVASSNKEWRIDSEEPPQAQPSRAQPPKSTHPLSLPDITTSFNVPPTCGKKGNKKPQKKVKKEASPWLLVPYAPSSGQGPEEAPVWQAHLCGWQLLRYWCSLTG